MGFVDQQIQCCRAGTGGQDKRLPKAAGRRRLNQHCPHAIGVECCSPRRRMIDAFGAIQLVASKRAQLGAPEASSLLRRKCQGSVVRVVGSCFFGRCLFSRCLFSSRCLGDWFFGSWLFDGCLGGSFFAGLLLAASVALLDCLLYTSPSPRDS